VNRSGWSSGNALVLLFIANTDVSKIFRAKAYESSTTQCPKLYIEWTSGGGQTYEINVDAVVKASALHSEQCTFNIEKDAAVTSQAVKASESTYNILKDAIVKASASPHVLSVYPINIDAVVKASATPSLQQTLGISKDAVVVAVSTPLIQSTFNISPEAVVKEGEVKVKRLFLIVGNIAIQLTGD